MSESDLREEEQEEEEMEDRRRGVRRGREGTRGQSYEQLDSLTLPLAPRRAPRPHPPPPGHLARAPSQATMHMTTVPQVCQAPGTCTVHRAPSTTQKAESLHQHHGLTCPSPWWRGS